MIPRHLQGVQVEGAGSQNMERLVLVINRLVIQLELGRNLFFLNFMHTL